MKIHRFISDYTIIENTITITDSELIHQWKNVLKFKIDEKIILSDINKNEVLCTIKSINKKEFILEVKEKYINKNESNKDSTLYLAILKRENFELVIQKATELGINRIVPIITQNTVKMGLKHERLAKIAKEASELSGRSTIPQIIEPMFFLDSLNDSKDTHTRIIFDISGTKIKIPEKTNEESIAIYVGPEGGFTESEINLAKENNLKIISLGTLTLRGETAGIIASYLAEQL